MKVSQPDHNRTLHITGLHELMDGPSSYPDEIDITINYTGQGNTYKAVILDGVLIPLIVQALKDFKPGA